MDTKTPDRMIKLDRTYFANKIYDYNYDITNPNFYVEHAPHNDLFIKGVHQHMNNLLQARKVLFLNDYLANLGAPLISEGQLVGWDYLNGSGSVQTTISRRDDSYVLHFAVDGLVYDLL